MLTPLDIAGKTFSKAINGYNKSEVEDFLNRISEQLEGLMREADYLKTQMSQADKRLAEYQSQENSLKDALLIAQIASNDLKKKTKEETENTVKMAEIEANKIMALASAEAEETRAKAKRDADKNLEQAKQDYTDIQNAIVVLKKDFIDFKDKYQYVLREQINVLDQLVVKDELTD